MVGGTGTDTLNIVDTGAATFALPAASVSGIENINIRNLNGAASVTGVSEVVTVTVGALVAGQTLIVAGQTLTATADLSAGAVAAALAGTATSGTGYTLSGTLATTHTKAAGTAGFTVVYTGAGTAGPITDLAVTGNSQTGINQVSKYLISTAVVDTGGTGLNIEFVFNGATVRTDTFATGTSAAAQAALVASAINGYAGKALATVDGAGGVVIISPTAVSIGGFKAVALDGTITTTQLAAAYALSPKSKVVTISTDAAATTGTFTYNGTSVTTGTATAATAVAAATAYVTAINTAAGATIASNVAGTSAAITINNGLTGVAIDNFAYAGSTFAETSIVLSTGLINASPATISIVQGVAAVTAGTGSTDTITATNFAGATAFSSDNSTNAVVFDALAAGQSAGMIGNGVAANGALTANYGSTVTSGTVNLSGGTKTGTVLMSGAAMTSATVNSTTATNSIGTLTLAATTTALTVNATTKLTTSDVTNTGGAALKTVTVTGEGAVSFGATALESTVVTVNAAANSGGLTFKMSSAAALAVTGGTGADVITTNSTLTTGSVDAGAGVDTLSITSGNVATAAVGAKYTNFETLRLNASQDVSLVTGITALELSAQTSGTMTKISAVQAAAIRVLGDQATGLVLTLNDATGSSDVVTLNLSNNTATTGAATNVDIAGLSIIGVETLNIAATSGTSSSANTTTSDDNIDFASGGATTLTVLNITGANDVNLVGTNITKAVTVNNSGTGIFTTSGNYAVGSVINGSATAVNAFAVGTAEGVTYRGGAGKDTFSFTQALILADGTTDTVISGGAGTDTLTLTDVTALVTDVHFTNITGLETLTLTGTTALSLTSGGSFKTAFADGVTITSGTVATATGAQLIYALGLYDKNVTLTLVTGEVGETTADSISVVTGAGNDIVSVTADSFVGHATTDGSYVINTGAGDDTITMTTGTLLANAAAGLVQVVGGTGADTITATHVNAGTGTTSGITFTMAAGASTTTAYDNITGFLMSDIGGGGGKLSDGLDFSSVAINAYGTTAAAGFTSAELTVAVSAAGLVTFAGTRSAAATLAEKIAAVQSVVITVAGDSAVFTHGADTYVFNNNATSDSVVKLVGILGAALILTNDATTDNGIYIL